MQRPAPNATVAGAGAIIAGRYRLVRQIGVGGMGQVYEAEHLELGRRFALKVLRLEKWSDELVARFRREAQALARLSTPHVAQVTDFGVADEVGPFYVMELVEGDTLEDRLEHSALAPNEVWRLGRAVAEALVEVHEAGLVHRDLKPSNIALPSRGPIHAKLLDFGLAAAIDDSFLSRLTQSQQVLGSLPYMSPEAFDGARPTPSMDLYALGVVLYEALSGDLPFWAPSAAALIHQIMAAPAPSLTQRAPNAPPALIAVVERLLKKEPSARFADAAELAAALAGDLAPASLPPTALGAPIVPQTIQSSGPFTPPTAASAPHAPHTRQAASVPDAAIAVTAPDISMSAAAAPRSSARIVAAALAVGVVLSALTAAAVVLLLDAGDTVTDSVSTPGATLAPVTPAVAPEPTPETAPPDPGVDETVGIDTEAVTGERHARMRGPVMRREPEPEEEAVVEPAVPPPPPSPTPTPMVTPMRQNPEWQGQAPIVDDSEFD